MVQVELRQTIRTENHWGKELGKFIKCRLGLHELIDAVVWNGTRFAKLPATTKIKAVCKWCPKIIYKEPKAGGSGVQTTHP